MAENSSALWSLTLDYFKGDIQKDEDNLIILVHWLLLKNNFQVLGSGNEKRIDENEQPTEFLPTNWSNDATYKLRYVRDKDLFLLNGLKVGDSLILNFYDVTTEHVKSAALNNICITTQLINNVANNKDDFVKIVHMLQTELINPMQKENNDKKVASTQTQSIQPESSIKSPLMISRMEPNNRIPITPRNSYGRSDLDPLGGLRNPDAGMIFDPMRVRNDRSMRFPGVPPMARFDPLLPESSRRPTPDFMGPPGFDIDYEMYT